MLNIHIYILVQALDHEISYNLYDFDDSEPDTWRYDVSECYSDDQKTSVILRLKGDKVSYNFINQSK